MPKVSIYLDDAKHPKTFKVSEKILEEIAREFQQEHPPEILFDITDDEENGVPIVTAKSPLEGGKEYRWKVAEEKWKNRKLIQNALFCSRASYDERPLKYLEECRGFHSVTFLIAANIYFDKQAASLFIANWTEGTNNQKKTLYVAFRGTQKHEDVVADFKIGFKTDLKFNGEIHGGFLDRMQSVSTEKIFEIAFLNKVDQIVTCGNSLGGAVSSLVHLKMLYDLENDGNDSKIDPENIINVTFGAPMIGNSEFAEHVDEKRYARNMFHFAYIGDIVPVVLSFGHIFEILEKNDSPKVIKDVQSQLRKVRPLFECCLGVAANISGAPEAKDIQKALESLKNLPLNSNQLQYVPIAKHLLIEEMGKGVSIKPVDGNPTIVERVLKSAIEFAIKGSLNFRKFHSTDNYRDLIKSSFRGFAPFPKKQICIDKEDCRMFQSENGHTYQFESVCSFTCGAFCPNTQPLNMDKQDVMFCKTCYEDPRTIENFFHVTCSEKFHANKPVNHIAKKIEWKKFRDKPDEWKKIFIDPDLDSHKMQIWQIVQATVGNTVAVPVQQILQQVSYTKGAFVLATELAELVGTRGLSKVVLSSAKANAIGAALMFGVSLSFDVVQFFRGKITAKEFAVAQFENLISSVASGGLSCAFSIGGAALGSLFGPIGSMLGLFVGGLIGGVAGYLAGKFSARKIAEAMGWCTTPEDEQKADLMVDAILLLEVPLPNGNLEEIREGDIMKCFRSKALEHHPDKLPVDASEKEKSECQLMWGLIDFSRNTLVAYSRDPHSLSGQVVKLVNKNWRMKKDQVDMLQMEKNIEEFRKIQMAKLAIRK